MRVCRRACASDLDLITCRLHHDWVFKGAQSACVERSHVEDINPLHLSQNFQTFQTGGLLEVGRDGTTGSSGRKQIGLGFDLFAQSVLFRRSRTDSSSSPSKGMILPSFSPGFSSYLDAPVRHESSQPASGTAARRSFGKMRVDIRRAVNVAKVRGAARTAWKGTRRTSEKAVRATDMTGELGVERS
jgi:hypothetical protein